ncbi:hypothetical protein Hanom_Chr09g00836671 [Helianthus anomalus]
MCLFISLLTTHYFSHSRQKSLSFFHLLPLQSSSLHTFQIHVNHKLLEFSTYFSSR